AGYHVDAPWLDRIVADRGGNHSERRLAPRPLVPAVPALRSSRDATVRARGEPGATLPTMLGLELRISILELQGDWLSRLSRSNRVRDDRRAERAAPHEVLGEVRGEA